MENDEAPKEFETLGALFRRLRLERSLDIKDVAEETRIPAKTIRAMELDEYDRLPAPAFARGFYSLYAGMLDLDKSEIICRYYEERSESNTAKPSGKLPSPSWQQHKNIGTMAGRPSLTPGSVIGSALLVLLLLVSGIFWYIGYNPATHISQWLRNFQEEPLVEVPSSVEQTPATEELQPVVIPEFETRELSPAPQSGVTVVENSRYQLAAEFPSSTEIRVTIDGGETESLSIAANTIRTWQAEEKIVLELPLQTKAELYLNGESLPLPAASGETITISIPE